MGAWTRDWPLLVVIGAIVMLIGAAACAGLLGWFGRLPGDLRYDAGNLKVYAPIVTMLLISWVSASAWRSSAASSELQPEAAVRR